MLSPVLLKSFLTLTALSLLPLSRQSFPQDIELYKIPVLNVNYAHRWKVEFHGASGTEDIGSTGDTHKSIWKVFGGGSSSSKPQASSSYPHHHDPIYQLPEHSREVETLLSLYIQPPNVETPRMIPHLLKNERDTKPVVMARRLWDFVVKNWESSDVSVEQQLPDAIIQATEYLLNQNLPDVHMHLWMNIFAAVTQIGRFDLPFTPKEIAIKLAMKNLQVRYGTDSVAGYWAVAIERFLEYRRSQIQHNELYQNSYEQSLTEFPGAVEILHPDRGISTSFSTWDKIESYIKFDPHLVRHLESTPEIRIQPKKTYERTLGNVMGMVWKSYPTTIQSKTAALIVLHSFSKDTPNPLRAKVAQDYLSNLLQRSKKLLPETESLLKTITSKK